MKTRTHRYTARAGSALAIKPEAFGWLFDEIESASAPDRIGPVAIVTVHGALDQRGSW